MDGNNQFECMVEWSTDIRATESVLLSLFSLREFFLNRICLACIVVILCVFVYLICICYTLCVFVIS